MGFSIDSKVKAIVKDDAARAVLDSILPGISTDPQLKLFWGLTVRKLADFPQSKEVGMEAYLPALDEALKALGD